QHGHARCARPAGGAPRPPERRWSAGFRAYQHSPQALPGIWRRPADLQPAWPRLCGGIYHCEKGGAALLYRIMVVDDEILIAEGVAQMVREMEGWELDVENAFSARQALELAQKRRFDLIVLDVQMPGMNGLE